MKAKELMIGDWVQIVEPCKYAGAIGRIKTLIDHKDDENAYFKVFLQNNTIHIGIEDICSEDIRPIPLTPEILEKNGFSNRYDGEDDLGYAQSCGTIIGIHICGKNGLMDEMYFKYVHELQQALRLCGIEKEIKL